MKLTEKFYEEERKKIRSFLGSGLFTLSVILIAGLAITYSQKKISKSTTTFSNGLIHEKALPIYCVDTSEPKVALSFDAAWGNGILCYMDY